MNKALNSLGALAATGATGTGGYFVTTECIIPALSKSGEPKYSTPKVDGYEDGTIGKIYGKYLLGSGKENEWKWEKMYDDNINLLSSKGIVSTSFGDSTTNTKFSKDSGANTALNQQCEAKYKTKLKKNGEEEGIDPTKEKSEWQALWLMCSPWNPTWLTDEELGNAEDALGKSKKNELLSTTGTDNEKLWESKNSDFFSLSTTPTEGPFKTLWESKGKPEGQNLRTTCANAYKLKASDGGSPTADEVVKYCSMKPLT